MSSVAATEYFVCVLLAFRVLLLLYSNGEQHPDFYRYR